MFEIWNIQYRRATRNFIHVMSPFPSRRRYAPRCTLYDIPRWRITSCRWFLSRHVKMNFFFRRRQVRFEERNARRETAVSVLHKAKLRKSTMDMKKKHCQGSKKQREREKREREIQQHLVIVRKSEIPSEKGAGWRRRRRSRREREERNCEHVQNGTRVSSLLFYVNVHARV